MTYAVDQLQRAYGRQSELKLVLDQRKQQSIAAPGRRRYKTALATRGHYAQGAQTPAIARISPKSAATAPSLSASA